MADTLRRTPGYRADGPHSNLTSVSLSGEFNSADHPLLVLFFAGFFDTLFPQFSSLFPDCSVPFVGTTSSQIENYSLLIQHCFHRGFHAFIGFQLPLACQQISPYSLYFLATDFWHGIVVLGRPSVVWFVNCYHHSAQYMVVNQ